ncbi:MAG TPA: two-component regulator propeller domain-containing protein, partial [Dokdonella sp.]|nr:two-component regulator propeller domain-containing protein [Dokdonella sp.]
MAMLACAGAGAHAQGRANHGVERVRFRNIGVEQGLSQASGVDIAQDRHGFIWVATQDGLDRFDGYGFRVYKHDRSDPSSLAANNIHRLLVDRQGRLWVGTTSGGLSRYDERLDRFDNFVPDATRADAIGSEYVSALLEDATGTLWIATRNHGLQHYDEAHGAFVDSRCEDDALRRPNSMALQADGHVLVGTSSGLFECDPTDGTMREWKSRAGAHLAVRTVVSTEAGDAWLTATRQGLFRFGADGEEIEHYDAQTSPSLDDTDLTGLLVDRNGAIWFGSENAGLSRLNPRTRRLETFTHAPEQPGSLAGNRAFSLFEDRDGQIWVGTWSNGISVFDPRAAGFVSVHTGGGGRSLPGASVLSVLADDDGT